MADKEASAEETGAEQEGTAGGKLKMIIFIVLGLLLTAAASIGVTWFLLKDNADDQQNEDINNIPLGEPEMTEEKGEAIYHALQPPFIVNYNIGGRSRFLQVELSVLTRDNASVELLVLHNPLIRNNLLDVFSLQDVAALMTAPGKEQLAADLTNAIQDIMVNELGRPGIETVLFRSFIMQ